MSQLTSLEQKASYGIGLQIGQQLQESGMNDMVPEGLLAGIIDAIKGNEPAIAIEDIHEALQAMHAKAEEKREAHIHAQAEAGKVYLENNAKNEGVNVTETGLQYRIITQGEGAIPTKTDRVSVHYTGKLVTGEVFDSSVARGTPAEFPVNGVIAGWIEALCLMPVGSKWELTIPYQLAYGERGAGGMIKPFSTLVFEVELLDIL
ncbi:FKBP-type peptidyl-prolyl cis-trans isomerase [Thorsellia anophelis]|uniref:Peptidyl-prolyl cis-trans isomerase n=1 Tax=Thorsellia anophelis DSM 18579 TaxID=1123402 RepID=A0A1I0EZE7_9GAMM|nr:FKBP-type peptidyl-prolyl cis-trans isomerase [Thorsellia anophelis]SET50511.1 FKBP-type peptidyl-prolyl cis-trans isomerase FklB [Thorsellia anophelis DSM 18579]